MNEVDCPKSVQEAIDILVSKLSKDDIAYIRKLDSNAFLHFSLGLHIRNRWIHHEKCVELYKDIWNTSERFGGWEDDDDEEDFFGEADDLSGAILDALRKYLREQG